MDFLKASTAVTVKIGPFLDNEDGDTTKTGLTIAQADVQLSKNGGAMAQKGNSTACTHDKLGYYNCPLSTTDTNTIGILKLAVHVSGALAVWHEFAVLHANVYDSLFGSTALATVGSAMTLAANQDVRNVSGTLPNVTLAATQGSYAPAKAGDKMDLVDAPNSTALVAIRTTMQAAGQTLATLLARIVGTLKSGDHEPQSGDAYAIVNHATNGNAAIKTAIGGLNNLSSGDVGTAVGTALGSYGAAKAGDRMDLVDAPNATAREAIRTTIQAAGSHLALIKAKTDNLPASPAGAEFKKNTAKSGFTFFMADSADHVTGKTGLNVTATRSLDGAAFDACANNVAEISGGFYKIDLAATDLNGDIVVLKFSANGADVTAFTIATGG